MNSSARITVAAVTALVLALLTTGCATAEGTGGAGPAVPRIFAVEKAAGKMSDFAETPAFEDDFDPGWKAAERGWRVATWKQNGAQMAPERCRPDGEGCIVQTVLPGEPYRGGSMQTAKEYPYGRWVARVKPSAVPGALHSVFSKDWDDLTTEPEGDGTGFEIDIELLTYTFGPGRGKVHLAIHGGRRGNLGAHPFTDDPDLDFNPSDDFHEWGFDIYPDRVQWHVDGKVFAVWKAPAGKTVPPGGHEFFFNSWTKPNWIKGPPKAQADYHIDWVRFYPLKKPQK